jgi:3-oxoacid CoA-transferase
MGDKVYPSAAAAIADLTAGASICVGGFGPVRNRAQDLLVALAARPEVNNLTLIANGFPFQALAENNQVSKLIAAFGATVGRRGLASEQRIRDGDMIVEPCPQGILTERLRAGAAGIPAFYSPVGIATKVAEGKEHRSFDGRQYIMETALRPDFAFVRAMTADEMGNLTGIGSTLNFHPTMAAAGRVTIAEVDEVVPTGSIAPEDVRIPGIYVDRIVRHDASKDEETERQNQAARQRAPRPVKEIGLTQDLMALRVARLLKPGQYVNLGMGVPVLVANFIDEKSGVYLHAENGIVGYGPYPAEGEEIWYHYNAIGQPVTVHPGAAFFSSLDAFTMARGGHLDVVVLGGLQVSPNGDFANWWTPDMPAGGMGGAMDLSVDVPELIVVMDHVTRDGEKKIVNRCTYPLTAAGCVTKVLTDLALIEVTPAGMVLREVAPGVSAAYVQERTEPQLIIAPECKEMEF